MFACDSIEMDKKMLNSTIFFKRKNFTSHRIGSYFVEAMQNNESYESLDHLPGKRDFELDRRIRNLVEGISQGRKHYNLRIDDDVSCSLHSERKKR